MDLYIRYIYYIIIERFYFFKIENPSLQDLLMHFSFLSFIFYTLHSTRHMYKMSLEVGTLQLRVFFFPFSFSFPFFPIAVRAEPPKNGTK